MPEETTAKTKTAPEGAAVFLNRNELRPLEPAKAESK
jgi:hypothetical protein